MQERMERDGTGMYGRDGILHGEGHSSPKRPLEEVGTVVAVKGGLADVLLKRSRRCEGCGSCCVLTEEGMMLAEAENPLGAKEGDRVAVSLPWRRSLQAAYILYGVPLLAFFLGLAAGGVLGWALFGGNLSVPVGLVFGFASLALSYVGLSRRYGSKSRASSPFRPVITRIL
jgi:sigma-E factor negative regulatory protein RseC